MPNPVTAILAGGLATRLGVLSSTVPKAMIEVGGEPFIAHQLRWLAQQNSCDVVICAGHLGEQVEDFAGDGSAFGCRVRYSFDGERRLGTGGALRRALPLLGDQFMVVYGDSYLHASLLLVWKQFIESRKSALMTIFRNEDQWDRSNVEVRDGEIVAYNKIVPTAAMRHIDYGLGCIRADALLAFAADGSRFDLASFSIAMLEQRELAGFEVTERFYEIGSLAGLAETDAFLRGSNQRRVAA